MKKLLPVLVVILLLQAILMPKYTGQDKEGSLIREYYSNAGNNDVILIGDCEVYENFSPVTLWEEYGIPSCIRGSPQQTVWQSCYLLEETFRYETPRVVVWNVLAMMYDTPESTGDPARREAYNRMTLDGMRWSFSKVKAIYASMTEEERRGDGILTYLFPILRFHDRWQSLTAEDFRYLFGSPAVSDNGYLMQTGVKPVTDEHVQPPPADYTFGENSYYYLEKMVELCREHGTQLVLIKAPSLYPIWWEQYEEQICRFAEDNGLLYLNLLEAQEEIGIDWSTDTYDTGLHLNVYGAEKASRYLGRILREEFDLPDRRTEEIRALWAEKSEIYHRRMEEMS